MDAIQTPRGARLSINQAEAWFRRNEKRYGPTDQVVLRGLFEYAHTPTHAMALRDELARRVISESPRTVTPAPSTQPPEAT